MLEKGTQDKRKILRTAGLLCVCALFFFIFYLGTKHSIYWDIYTLRDLHRAVDWLKGQFYWPGPEMTAGNNLPGPLFYFLLFPPLLFGDDIYSQSLLWRTVWLSLTYATAFYFASKITAHRESLLVFLILSVTITGPTLLAPISFAWNPAFAILFHILALMGLYYWRETHKNLYLYITGLIIALGIQVHFLVATHIITALLFYFFEKKKKIMPMILFSLSALFFVLLYKGAAYFDAFERQPVKAPLYLWWLMGQIFSQEWFEHIKVIFGLSWIGPLVFLFFLMGSKKSSKWPLSQSTKNLIIIMIIPSFIAILSIRLLWYGYFIPSFLLLIFVKMFDDLTPNNPDKRWNYLLALGWLSSLFVFLVEGKAGFPFLKEPLSAGMDHYILFPLIFGIIWLNIKWTYKIQVKALIFFFFCVFISHAKMIHYAQPWTPHLQESFSRDWLSHKYQGLFPVMEEIFLETNWTPKKAMKQIHVIGIRDEISLLAYYAMAREKVKNAEGRSFPGRLYHLEIDSVPFLNSPAKIKQAPALNLSSEISTGYIIIQHLKKFTGYSKTDWKKALSYPPLLSDPLRREIAEGKILIKNPQLYNSYWLIPYIVTEESIFVEGFHNTGQPYYWEQPEWLKHCGPSSQHFKDQSGFYYCKVLPGKGSLARAGIHVKVSEDAQKKPRSPLSLDINFFGPLIGSWDLCSALPCLDMRTNRVMSDIKINLLCDDTYFKYREDIIIGNDDQGIHNPGLRGQRFTAPLKLSRPLSAHCKKDNIRQMELIFSMAAQQKRSSGKNDSALVCESVKRSLL